jgi:hypothetical protein
MDSALASGALDLVGIARPAVLNPLAPTNTLLDKDNGNARVAVASIKIPWLLNKIGNYVIGAGYETVSPDALFLRIMVLTLDPRLGT